MKIIKRLLQILVVIIIVCTSYVLCTIIYGSITDYKPCGETSISLEGGSPGGKITDTLTIMSWNIGFCGLGAEMDFFFDGGGMVRPSNELVEKYTGGIIDFLKGVSDADFIILQEVDRNSARTNFQDEAEIIALSLPAFSWSYAYNYKVGFVPIPFLNPIGKINAGQMNLSKAKPALSKRIAFQSGYSWPKKVFMLDRCFIASYFEIENGRQLVLINTHNSAYDKGGKLRKQEMLVVSDFMMEEFKKGNYVIAGGDWNQNPPGYTPVKMRNQYLPIVREIMDKSLFPGNWQIVYDPEIPTNREINTPMPKGATPSTIIDYFIVSPNIEVIETKTTDLKFEHSDHQPVFIKVSFKNI